MEREQQVKKFINSLLKTIKGLKLYRSKSRLPQRFLKETYDILLELLKDGPQTFDIDRERILYSGKEVHRDDNKITSLPLFFYRNGIRSITFLEGLELEELERFVDIVAKSEFVSDLNLSEDLWENNFVNIIFTIVELPMGDYSWIIEDRVDVYKGGMKFAGVLLQEEKKMERGETEKYVSGLLVKGDREDTLIKTVFNLILLENNEERIIQVASVLGEYLERSIEDGDAVPLLIFLRYLDENIDKIKVGKEYVYDLKRILCGEKALNLYSTLLKSGEKSNIPLVMELLGTCEEGAVKVIQETLDDIIDDETVREMGRILYRVGSNDPNSIVYLLESDNPRVVYLGLEVVKALSDKTFIPYLEKLLKENRYKEKVIKILIPLVPRERLFHFLETEDYTIRMNVYRAIRFITGEDEASVFLEKVNSPDFWNLSTDERRHILRIISTFKSYDTVRALSRVLSKYTMNPEHIETKKYAVKMLGEVGTKDAIAVLKKHRWSRHLRRTVKEVLKRHEKG
ncbi:hypothetical protein DRQ23_01695 [bacterium]|nr:MAG: hypothetical protein DRQ23_01695 [bacterium]